MMKFLVTSSSGHIEDNIKLLKCFYQVGKEWYLDIGTIEELMNFLEIVGTFIISGAPDKTVTGQRCNYDNASYAIEIYDSYRE